MFSRRLIRPAIFVKSLGLLLAAVAFAMNVPRVWDKAAVDSLELPLVEPKVFPTHIDEAAYYGIPERVIYKSYPVYAPGREPAGYKDWLNSVEPTVSFDPSILHTQQQLVSAGEIVFNAPTTFH